MNDNGNIRLLTPENDMRVRAFLSSLEELSEKVEKIRENNKPSLDGERYYTDKELAVRLKVSRRSLQDYRNNGILPYIQIGGRILYRASDIERTLMDGYKGVPSEWKNQVLILPHIMGIRQVQLFISESASQVH